MKSDGYSFKASLKPFFKGVADGKTDHERHNKFAVRFKFRVLETLFNRS